MRGSCQTGNITLIGMPASGKSTVGVVLAKHLGMRFIDTDLVIQEETGKLLKDLIEEEGDSGFRETEDRINASIKAEHAVIAPGGSVVYGKNAMKHLKKISTVVYLKLSFPAVRKRLGDLHDRGVTIKEGQTLMDLYEERSPLYEKYADIIIEETGKSTRRVVEMICGALGYPEETDGRKPEKIRKTRKASKRSGNVRKNQENPKK